MSDSTNAADVVIVGGGSAGAVLAARLTDDVNRTVLLREAVPVYALDAIPAGLLDASQVADPDHDWGYLLRASDRQLAIPTPRGKVLGGSSSVNATVAIRARASDLAKWASLARKGGAMKRSSRPFVTSRTRRLATTAITSLMVRRHDQLPILVAAELGFIVRSRNLLTSPDRTISLRS